MEPLIGPFTRIPNWARRFLSQNPEEKTWVCPTCGEIAPFHWGMGYYARRRCACEVRAIDSGGQTSPLTEQHLVTQTRLAQVYCWLGGQWGREKLAEKTFATFERERQPRAFDLARTFAHSPQGTLFLCGSYGLGKTHLLSAIANLRREQGKASLFASMVMFFDAIGERIGNEQDYHDLIRRAIATPLLLLDDIEKPKASEFRKEVLYQIIDGRTRVGRPMAVSSNTPLEALSPVIGGAARSRLMIGLVPIRVIGSDYRSTQMRTEQDLRSEGDPLCWHKEE